MTGANRVQESFFHLSVKAGLQLRLILMNTHRTRLKLYEDLNNQFPGTRAALEDNPGSAATDTYYRVPVSTEIVTRNLRVQANL